MKTSTLQTPILDGMPDPSSDGQDVAIDGRTAAILVDNHRAFLRYLERRVGSREAAEDILQDAFVRHLARTDAAPDEGLVPWFYRVLRNATIDRHRRQQVADRALETFARDVETRESPAPDLAAEICACVGRLAGTLKPPRPCRPSTSMVSR
jgi:RNA polymerase sigma factor (sigma-70 family)